VQNKAQIFLNQFMKYIMKKNLHATTGIPPGNPKPSKGQHCWSKKMFLLMAILCICVLYVQAQTTVSGIVKDESGQTIPGVSVGIKGTTTGMVTDKNGHYSLHVPLGSTTLVFSFIGYIKKEIEISGRSIIDLNLVPEQKSLNEVVVIGYGTQNKRDVTGAVSTIKASDLNHTNAVSADNMIQGKAAGVSVNTYTSQPGGNVSVVIRGALSPNGSNSPLYVIDGLPLTAQAAETSPAPGGMQGNVDRSPLASINPNDIESIDILKDASATAIYGSAAANGVVLITTKKGKEGATRVSYGGTYSVQTLKKYLVPLNATQFENGVNDYGLEYFKVNNNLAPYGKGTVPITNYAPFFTPAQIAAAGKGTNYVDYILRNGEINDQNFSISSGNANTKVFSSFNYFDQKGLIKNSNFKRLAGRINVDQKIGSRVNFSLGVTYSQVNNDNVPVGNSQGLDAPSMLQTALQFAPDIPLLNAQGLPSQSYYTRTPNPGSYFRILNQTSTRRIIITPNIQVNILDGLKFTLAGGIDNNSSTNQYFVPVSANFISMPNGDAQMSYSKNNNYSGEGYLNYNRKFGKSSFSGVAGVGYYESNNSGFGLEAQGFSTDVFGVNNIGIASLKNQFNVNSFKNARAKLSQFTRMNYTYDDKYILQLTGRFDGTSNFPQNHLFGFFPGASVGWLVNQENFLKDVHWLSQLKLRGGYGTSGNESITTNGNYGFSLYGLYPAYAYLIGNQYYNSGFTQTQLGNPDLKWETDAQLDAAVDFGFFNNRISGSFDYFNRTAKDLLDFRVLPSQNAITTQAFNVGSTRSRGVELTLRTENIRSRNFTWSSILTFSTAKAYWVNRNPAVAIAPYVGYNDPLHAVYGWKTAGLIRTAADIPTYQTGAFVGNIKYIDINHDDKLDINDVAYLGNTDPKGNFGLTNTLRYKDIDFSFFFYGSYGYYSTDAYMQFVQTKAQLVRAGAPTNVEVHSLDIWTSFNPNGTYPGLATDAASANNPTFGTSDFRAVSNSYFVRLKNVTIGYSLPQSLLAKQKFVRSLRVFVDAQNLFVITNTKGMDPEFSRDNNPYPVARTTAFGITAQF
jgi:TonB-linked SusC/RagA family outer membrane protein